MRSGSSSRRGIALLPEPAVLSLAGATRRFGPRLALDGVSLQVFACEVYGLVGANGAGKSTLARAAIGAVRLDGGEVRVLGDDPWLSRRARAAVGVAPQEIALYPRLTIRENLLAFAALAGVPRRRRSDAAGAAMTLAACAARGEERIEALSGGWRRRANLAAALVHRPRLLVLDEPTEGLDAETRTDFFRVLRELREAGTAVLLITHDGPELAAAADRIGVLHEGRLLAEGAPAALLASTFGDEEDLVVRLRTPASAAADGELRACGFAADAGGWTWRRRGAGSAALARRLHDQLPATGVQVAELSVRAPSLSALAERLAGAAR